MPLVTFEGRGLEALTLADLRRLAAVERHPGRDEALQVALFRWLRSGRELRFESQGAFASYIAKAQHRLRLDLQKREQNYADIPEATKRALTASISPSGDDYLLARDVWAALQTLSWKEREAFLLAAAGHRPHEIAAQLGRIGKPIGKNEPAKLVRRAGEKLLRCLGLNHASAPGARLTERTFAQRQAAAAWKSVTVRQQIDGLPVDDWMRALKWASANATADPSAALSTVRLLTALLVDRLTGVSAVRCTFGCVCARHVCTPLPPTELRHHVHVALDASRVCGDRDAATRLLLRATDVLFHLGDERESTQLIESALAIAVQQRDAVRVDRLVEWLLVNPRALRGYRQRVTAFSESVRFVSDPGRRTGCLRMLTKAYLALDEPRLARSTFEELWGSGVTHRATATELAMLEGTIAAAEGDWERAYRCFEGSGAETTAPDAWLVLAGIRLGRADARLALVSAIRGTEHTWCSQETVVVLARACRELGLHDLAADFAADGHRTPRDRDPRLTADALTIHAMSIEGREPGQALSYLRHARRLRRESQLRSCPEVERGIASAMTALGDRTAAALQLARKRERACTPILLGLPLKYLGLR